MPDIKRNGRTFSWGEATIGKNRGISLAEKGVAGSNVTFELKWQNQKGTWSNVHQWSDYNKGQAKFYTAIATNAVDYRMAHNAWPPSPHDVQYQGETFRLELSDRR